MNREAVYAKISGRLPGIELADCVKLNRAFEASEPKCLTPDVPDAEIADSTPDEVEKAIGGILAPELCQVLPQLHKRMAQSTGRGSWPVSCVSEYPHKDSHAASVYIDYDSFMKNSSLRREVTDDEWLSCVVQSRVWPSVDRPVRSVEEAKLTFVYGGDAVAAFDRPEWASRAGKKRGDTLTLFDMSTWLVFESHRRAGVFMSERFTDGKHNIHELMKAIPGSVAGFAYFNDGTCGDHVTSNIDSLLTYSLVRIADLRCHEFGHNQNLQHEFSEPQSRHRSIMSYSSTDPQFQGFRLNGEPYEYVEDHSWKVLRRFFGGEPAKPPTPVVVPPIDPPSTGELGKVTVSLTGLSVEWNKPPKPGTYKIVGKSNPWEI